MVNLRFFFSWFSESAGNHQKTPSDLPAVVLNDIIRMVTFGGGNITECSYRGVWNDIEGRLYVPRRSRGLIFFPKYHFKPQDTGNIPWCSRQQSRHLLYCMATHCLARLRHSSQKFTKLFFFFQRGFPLSCAQCNAYPLYCAPQCNAYPLYCARNKKPVRG